MFGLDLQIVAFGLGVGILVGMTGIGGGSLMTPLLILFGGISPSVAIGTDLAYSAVTKTLGGWRHLRAGTVDLGITKWMAFGSVPGAVGGVIAINALHHAHGKDFDKYLLAGIAIALTIVAVTILGRTLFMPHLAEREQDSVVMTRNAKLGAIVMGLVLGSLVGATSVGSGALIGLLLIVAFRLTPHRVVGTDVVHAALLLWAAGIAHWIGGNVDFHLMGTILVGSMPGILIGTHLMPKVPAGALRVTLGCVLIGSALGVASKAGADVSPYVILAAPILLGLIIAVVQRVRSPRADPVPA